MSQLQLASQNRLFVHQVREVAELFGFETRNKYQILYEQKQPIAYAAEQGKGLLGFIFRQYLGHWRKFDVHFMSPQRELLLVAHHPFRWFFERIEIRDSQGLMLGAIQKKFSFFTKRFDVEDLRGNVLMEVASPFFKFWTFTFTQRNRDVAVVQKKWAGLLNEAFTDKDTFMVEYSDVNLGENERTLVMASSIFIDLLFFEKKAR